MFLGLRATYLAENRCICGAIDCNLQGLCHCGCGAKAPTTNSTRKRGGKYFQIRGLPVQFLPNHRAKVGLRDKNAHRTKGSYNKSILAQMEEFKKIFHGKCHCGCGQDTELATRTVRDRDNVRCAVAGLPKRYVIGHEPQIQKGPSSPFFKGAKVTTHGYIKVYLPEHPRADKGGYIPEHHFVMEKHIGRLLYRSSSGGHNTQNDEIVHHIDGDKKNNKIDNLQLMTHSEHMRLHRQKHTVLGVVDNKGCMLHS